MNLTQSHFERHILLPENADTEFICAEYRAGYPEIVYTQNERASENNSITRLWFINVLLP